MLKPLFTFFLILAAALGQDWNLGETGLCIERLASCPAGLQRYGVCCRVRGVATEFNNYCLACAAVIMGLFRGATNGSTNSPPAAGARDMIWIAYTYLCIFTLFIE